MVRNKIDEWIMSVVQDVTPIFVILFSLSAVAASKFTRHTQWSLIMANYSYNFVVTCFAIRLVHANIKIWSIYNWFSLERSHHGSCISEHALVHAIIVLFLYCVWIWLDFSHWTCWSVLGAINLNSRKKRRAPCM